MSLSSIQNVVLLFSNPVWTGANTVPSTIIRNVTGVTRDLAYEQYLDTNITTLTTSNAQTLNGKIQGLLYVPDISTLAASCNAQQYDFIPSNVTRRAELPPTNYNLIALAPWFSIDCTLAYLSAAHFDPIRAFIFYKPNNSTDQPQDADSPIWNLDDGGAWLKSKFPIFAIPGLEGFNMMNQLSLYSGSVKQVPHGEQILQRYQPNASDYVRIWTELRLESKSSLPSLWVYFLIVIGGLIFIVALVSLTMHFVQRRRRSLLRKRVESGEVDLEALGVKRLTVPASHVRQLPLFTYTSEPESVNLPMTLSSESSTNSSRPSRSARRTRLRDRASASDLLSQGGNARSVRSKRSALTGISDAIATNFQPHCHICLEDFEDRLTIIRELSCHHIFHPRCIDEFLLQNSSLCPVCKQSMLPRGYCPKITNGMVRRERALRRLRERVDLDDTSLESQDWKLKGWSKRILHSMSRPQTSSNYPLVPLKRAHGKETSSDSTSPGPTSHGSVSPPPEEPPTGEGLLGSSSEVAAPTQPPTAKKKARPRTAQRKALTVLPTQPEGAKLKTTGFVGRHSPSSFARERMREIAEKNAPFDDPDSQNPAWRRAVSKVFPGFT